MIIPLLALLAFSGCKDDDAPSITLQRIDRTFTVEEKDWGIIDNGVDKYRKCECAFEELTEDVLKNGGPLNVYLVMEDEGNEADFYGQLPYIRYFGSSSSTENVSYAQVIDCEFSKGVINFFVTNSDFTIDNPGKMTFRAIMQYQ